MELTSEVQEKVARAAVESTRFKVVTKEFVTVELKLVTSRVESSSSH